MDAGIVGSIITLLFFLVFVAIIWWGLQHAEQGQI